MPINNRFHISRSSRRSARENLSRRDVSLVAVFGSLVDDRLEIPACHELVEWIESHDGTKKLIRSSFLSTIEHDCDHDGEIELVPQPPHSLPFISRPAGTHPHFPRSLSHRVSQSCSPVDLFFFRLQITIMIHDKRLYSFPSPLCVFATLREQLNGLVRLFCEISGLNVLQVTWQVHLLMKNSSKNHELI